MLDLDCKRDQALAEYQEALKTRDGQQDTRLAAERGVKTAYAVNGHSCDEDADDDRRPRRRLAPDSPSRQASGTSPKLLAKWDGKAPIIPRRRPPESAKRLIMG